MDGDRKGSYTKLDNGFAALLSDLGEENELLEDCDFVDEGAISSPTKPPLFSFDFVEVCGGVGKVSRSMSRRGFVVAPNLDLTHSEKYDLRDLRLLQWLIHMVQNKLFRSMMLEPPCTTFSAAAHPACRSYAIPEGWDRLNPKVLHGNALAFRCLLLVYVCVIADSPSLLEQPRLSKMAWLSFWKWLLSQGCQEAVVASCQFGSIHRKEFRLLVWRINAQAMTVKCPGGHSHVPIQGSYTRDSAIYTDGVADHFADNFAFALQEKRLLETCENSFRSGKESVITNDILRTGGWRVVRHWFWKKKSHINLLES